MKALFSVLLVSLVTATANAAIYIEPYVGYQLGTLAGKATISSTAVDLDFDITGATFGGKLGYESMDTFAFGVDFMSASLKEKTNNTITGDSGDHTDLGAFVSFDLPLIKLAATYFVQAKYKNDTAEAEGSGMKATVGLGFIPFIDINVDYIMKNYDKLTKPTAGTNTADFDVKTLMVGVSLPLSF